MFVMTEASTQPISKFTSAREISALKPATITAAVSFKPFRTAGRQQQMRMSRTFESVAQLEHSFGFVAGPNRTLDILPSKKVSPRLR